MEHIAFCQSCGQSVSIPLVNQALSIECSRCGTQFDVLPQPAIANRRPSRSRRAQRSVTDWIVGAAGGGVFLVFLFYCCTKLLSVGGTQAKKMPFSAPVQQQRTDEIQMQDVFRFAQEVARQQQAQEAQQQQQHLREAERSRAAVENMYVRCRACGGNGVYSFVDGAGNLITRPCPRCGGAGQMFR
jgi:DnaJ-class molecular chaperone